MVTWFKGKTAEEMVELCESAGGGYYPVGQSNMWHSGVHFMCGATDETAVYPIISGKVIAKRLGDYKEVAKPETIPEDEYDALPLGWIQKHYNSPAYLTSLSNLFTAVAELKTKTEYEKFGYKNYSETYKYSNSFVLLEHECFIGQDKTLKFYTLYMNLEGIEATEERETPEAANEAKNAIIKNEFLIPKIGESVTPATKLGRPGLHPYEHERFYDFAVFFPKDDNFMDLTQNIDDYKYYFYSIGSDTPQYIGTEVDFELTNIEPTDPTDKNIEAKACNMKKQSFKGVEYCHFTELGENIYISSTDMEASKKNAVSWDDYFNKVEEKGLDKGDLYFNLAKVLPEDKVKSLPWLTYEEEDDNIRSGDILKIFNPAVDSDPGEEVKKLMRKIVCTHPLEWQKSLYYALYARYERYWSVPLAKVEATEIAKIAGAIDIWDALKNKKGFTTNIFWFAHPVYFIDHLDKAGLFGYNPYAMKIVKPRFARYYEDKNPTHVDPTEIEVKSCPGFAPAHTTSVGTDTRFPAYLQDATNPKHYWAEINCVFGYSWGYGNGTKEKNHIGVDFAGIAGSSNVPIISMITGVVWATTSQGKVLNIWGQKPPAVNNPGNGYGKLMIIKDMNNDLLYLLAHLSDYKKNVGEYVYPGETVALVGDTGGSFGAHLHLEVFECDATEKTKVLLGDVNSPLAWNRPSFKQEDYRINPLDHSEKQAKE